jgi:hypothetical protein
MAPTPGDRADPIAPVDYTLISNYIQPSGEGREYLTYLIPSARSQERGAVGLDKKKWYMEKEAKRASKYAPMPRAVMAATLAATIRCGLGQGSPTTERTIQSR